MMDAGTKRQVKTRLRRIAGQVEAIERMVDDDRYCVDVLTQVAAVQAALARAADAVLRAHVETCVVDAMRSGSPRARKQKIDELMAIVGRYAS